MATAHDMPCHRERPSLLSASSGYENYRGFLNLLYVILGIGSCRLVIENILRYGLLIDFNWPIKFLKDPTNWPSVFLIVLINIFILFEFWLELRLSKIHLIKSKIKTTLIFFQFINLFTILIFPAAYIYYREPNPYLISVPLRMIRPWSFLAMIIQLPMGLAVKRISISNKTYGNLAVWISLILIQPIAILLYIQDLFYRDFIKDKIYS
ncbi:unnamed protein product [Rotaria sp. Silwood1]|nr:unnamed protein product [Rotaria sp. Silwood1]